MGPGDHALRSHRTSDTFGWRNCHGCNHIHRDGSNLWVLDLQIRDRRWIDRRGDPKTLLCSPESSRWCGLCNASLSSKVR